MRGSRKSGAAAPALRPLRSRRPCAPLVSRNGAAHHDHQPDPSLARSRLLRSGLKAGAAAPEFRLPRIDGGELSLDGLRDRRVLLVFTDPRCGPCDELAPRLQELHQKRPDLQVIAVSRRDAEETRAKAATLRLTFPIVMQKNWEISLKYGMFATPIGYLIDERGTIVRDVAVGVEPILTLADEAAGAHAGVETTRNGTAAARAS